MPAESDAVVPQELVEEERSAAPQELPSMGEPPREGEGQREKPASLRDRLRRFFFPATEREERLQHLNEAIADSPDAAVNYLLRGELYLEMRKEGLARADFEEAAALAEEQYEAERWGIGAQSIQDRALRHLKRLAE